MSDQAKVTLYNLALDELGQAPISSFDDESPGAENAASRYDLTIAFIRGLRIWSFEKEVVPLTLKAGTPATGYSYAFEIPHAEKVLAVFSSIDTRQRPLLEGWRVYRGDIHANYNQLWAEVKVETDPDTWPPVFRMLCAKALAAAICMQHTGNSALRRVLSREAYGEGDDYPRGGLVDAAVAEDGLAEPADALTIGAGALIEAREY